MKPMAILVLLLILSGALANAEDAPMPDRSPVFKRAGDVELRMHIFVPPDHEPPDKRPAIVFFFGGDWQTGSAEQFFGHCRYFASRGMVAMSAEYRVKNRHGVSPRDCVTDGKSAIRWVRQHAEELGIDPDKLAAAGASSGAQIAAATGSSEGFNEEGEDLSISCRPDALVLFSRVLDTGPDGFAHNWVKGYWQDFSPMHNIGEDTPPTAIFLGTADPITSVGTARKYQRLMAEAGVRCDLHTYEDQPHRFFNKSVSEEHYRRTTIEADRFMASLGYLEGEPTLPLEPRKDLPGSAR
jgi:acetyl esterase/lipase